MNPQTHSQTTQPSPQDSKGSGSRTFARGLGLFDSVMVVVGVMIGSGIFIVSAEMSRQIGSAGWLLVAWAFAGFLTVAAALSYGELAAMMPHAGGMYIFLREAFSPLWGFLYGWTLVTVIQTGTIAAVAIAFARFSGVLFPWVSEDHYLIAPLHISTHYAFSLSSAQALAIILIAVLTWTNSRGLEYGKIVQNVFTVAKTAALLGLILLGLTVGWNMAAVRANFTHAWTAHGVSQLAPGLTAATVFGLFAAVCLAQTGSLFAADAWHDITFTAGEVKDPRRTLPLSLAIGTILVIALYLLANVAYLVTLPLSAIQHAPSDRVATTMLNAIFPTLGAALMAIAIIISTVGCVNALTLAGARTYYAMARDGLFFRVAGRLNKARVPGPSLLIQGLWAAFLVLPRTYDPATHTYGNLYNNLLNYLISVELIFYILTIAAVFRLRIKKPDAERPYRAFGYPWLPTLYILGATAIMVMLFMYQRETTWPGLIIVLLGLPIYFVLARRPDFNRAPERDFSEEETSG
ncbi:MAG TPA: APC family permease [Candidatus Acidoferrales bacterium]|nr:APC family permease [Candidatus Acidoferrales bacterium]